MFTVKDVLIAGEVLRDDGGEGSGVRGHTTPKAGRLERSDRPLLSRQGDRRITEQAEAAKALDKHVNATVMHATAAEFARSRLEASRHLTAARLHLSAAREHAGHDINGLIPHAAGTLSRAEKASPK